MADLKYIMQGFQEDINFFDEIKEVLEKDDFTSVWILTAFINEHAIYNLMPSIKKSKADISFIIGIRNNVSTYQALECLINRNLLGGLYRENPVKSRNYEAVKSSKKWENVGNSYIIPALLLYRYSYI